MKAKKKYNQLTQSEHHCMVERTALSCFRLGQISHASETKLSLKRAGPDGLCFKVIFNLVQS